MSMLSDPPLIIDSGSWHLRIGTSTNNMISGPNQIGYLEQYTSSQYVQSTSSQQSSNQQQNGNHKPFFWSGLQALLETQIGTLLQLYFPKRFLELDSSSFRAQMLVWDKAIKAWEKKQYQQILWMQSQNEFKKNITVDNQIQESKSQNQKTDSTTRLNAAASESMIGVTITKAQITPTTPQVLRRGDIMVTTSNLFSSFSNSVGENSKRSQAKLRDKLEASAANILQERNMKSMTKSQQQGKTLRPGPSKATQTQGQSDNNGDDINKVQKSDSNESKNLIADWEMVGVFAEIFLDEFNFERIAVVPDWLMSYYDDDVEYVSLENLSKAKQEAEPDDNDSESQPIKSIPKSQNYNIKLNTESESELGPKTKRLLKQAIKLPTKLLIDLGFACARVVAVVEGNPINPNNVYHSLHLGGYFLSSQLRQHIDQRQNTMTTQNLSQSGGNVGLSQDSCNIYQAEILKQKSMKVHTRLDYVDLESDSSDDRSLIDQKPGSFNRIQTMFGLTKSDSRKRTRVRSHHIGNETRLLQQSLWDSALPNAMHFHCSHYDWPSDIRAQAAAATGNLNKLSNQQKIKPWVGYQLGEMLFRPITRMGQAQMNTSAQQLGIAASRLGGENGVGGVSGRSTTKRMLLRKQEENQKNLNGNMNQNNYMILSNTNVNDNPFSKLLSYQIGHENGTTTSYRNPSLYGSQGAQQLMQTALLQSSGMINHDQYQQAGQYNNTSNGSTDNMVVGSGTDKTNLAYQMSNDIKLPLRPLTSDSSNFSGPVDVQLENQNQGSNINATPNQDYLSSNLQDNQYTPLLESPSMKSDSMDQVNCSQSHQQQDQELPLDQVNLNKNTLRSESTSSQSMKVQKTVTIQKHPRPNLQLYHRHLVQNQSSHCLHKLNSILFRQQSEEEWPSYFGQPPDYVSQSYLAKTAYMENPSSSFESQPLGLAELVYNVVEDTIEKVRLDINKESESESQQTEEIRRQLLNNIVLSGGGSRVPGIETRLLFELIKLFGSESRNTIRIALSDELGCYRGCINFAKNHPEKIPWIRRNREGEVTGS